MAMVQDRLWRSEFRRQDHEEIHARGFVKLATVTCIILWTFCPQCNIHHGSLFHIYTILNGAFNTCTRTIVRSTTAEMLFHTLMACGHIYEKGYSVDFLGRRSLGIDFCTRTLLVEAVQLNTNNSSRHMFTQIVIITTLEAIFAIRPSFLNIFFICSPNNGMTIGHHNSYKYSGCDFAHLIFLVVCPRIHSLWGIRKTCAHTHKGSMCVLYHFKQNSQK